MVSTVEQCPSQTAACSGGEFRCEHDVFLEIGSPDEVSGNSSGLEGKGVKFELKGSMHHTHDVS